MNLRGQPSLRHDFQPFRLGVCLVIVGPLELRESRARNSACLEPPVAVCLTAGAVGPSALLGDIERTRGIDGRFAAMGLADADELDESAIHYDAVTERETGLEPAKPSAWEADALPTELLPRCIQILFVLRQPPRISEISRGLATVIVRAPDFAFCDLCGQADQIASTDKPRNCVLLHGRVDVVELEDPRIGFAAVNTWMSQ